MPSYSTDSLSSESKNNGNSYSMYQLIMECLSSSLVGKPMKGEAYVRFDANDGEITSGIRDLGILVDVLLKPLAEEVCKIIQSMNEIGEYIITLIVRITFVELGGRRR